MLAAKSPYSSSLQGGSGLVSGMATPSAAYASTTRRALAASAGGGATAGGAGAGGSGGGSGAYASPTDSEFSDADAPDAVKHWDEDRVCEYLRSVHCGDYETLFRRNHINGENLLEMDKEVLKEMGIEKVGDRVRLFLSIKKLRTKAYAHQKKRNRESFGLDIQYVPAGSPRHLGRPAIPTPPANKRYSRQVDLSSLALEGIGTKSSRPNSPLSSAEQLRSARPSRYPTPNPANAAGVANAANSANPANVGANGGGGGGPATRLVAAHTRNNSSIDGSLMAALPKNQDVIRVISTGGGTKVVKIADCKTCEEVMRVTLRKFALREDHERNYCFWVLAGVDPDPSQCIRLSDTELWRIIKDQKRPERNRLILRRVPAGEPGQLELERAAAIALEELNQAGHSSPPPPPAVVDKRSQLKVQKVLGESWDSLQAQPPLSPLTYQDRERNVHNAARDLERPAPAPAHSSSSSVGGGTTRRQKGVLRQFGGLRPPSELIASDLTTYFPDHPREDIDRTARLSMRRSARLSKVNSRLSVASNLSFASSIQDAPPIPTIADSWLSATSQLAKVQPRGGGVGGGVGGRLGAGLSPYRDSVASSMLDTLQEEQAAPSSAGLSTEPDRKSYVPFTDSGSDTAVTAPTGGTATAVSVTDPDGNAVDGRFYDGATTVVTGTGTGTTVSTVSTVSGASSTSTSLKEVSQALDADGEGADEELQSFLAGESWDDSQWMKGALIGSGSFGCVYLALHAVTGELLAVKQVEMPSPGASSSQTDARKKSMIEALKREISLLRDLRHPNIVQYLGCGSSPEYLNIFLEYVPGGSVQTMLNSYGALPEPLVRSFVRQILQGLSYLHARDIIHRDIKGANILVDNKGTIKISDFGISKKLEATNMLGGANTHKHRPSLQGSVFWMAPEVVKQTSYTRKADIWSLGCLVVEMMTGTHPFPDCTQLQAIFKIGGSKAAPTIPPHASAEAQLFLRQTFEINHNKRPSADELLASPFLTPIT